MKNRKINQVLYPVDDSEYEPIYTDVELYPEDLDITVQELMDKSDEELSLFSEELRQHWLKNRESDNHPIFPGNKTKNQVIKELKEFQDENITGILIKEGADLLLKYNSKRSNPVNNYFPEIWDVPVNGKSVFGQLENKDTFYKNMHKVVRKQFANSKTIKPDHSISKYLTQALRILNRVQPVYNYPPPLARYTYLTVAEKKLNIDNPTFNILDLCGGWAGRFVGALAAFSQPALQDKIVTFHCTDVNSAVHDRFQMIYRLWGEYINSNMKNFNFYKSLVPAEDIMLDPIISSMTGKYDIILTSPPYYRKELYSDDPMQSCNRYRSYVDWSYGFLRGIIRNSAILLKPGGELWLNIANIRNSNVSEKGIYYPLERDTLYFAEKYGLVFKAEYKIISSIMPGMSRTVEDTRNPEPYHSIIVSGKKKKYEPLFRFVKVD